MVVRYSQGDDIIVLTPGGPNQDIVTSQTGIPGLTGFIDPLDLVEDPRNGYIYLCELAPRRIQMLRPLPDLTAIGDPEPSSRLTSRIDAVVPNPGRERTTFRFFVAASGPVRLEVYEPGGGHVRTLLEERYPHGSVAASWDGSDERGRRVRPGVYFVRLIAPDRTTARAFTLLE
jgi:hypothetical protein